MSEMEKYASDALNQSEDDVASEKLTERLHDDLLVTKKQCRCCLIC